MSDVATGGPATRSRRALVIGILGFALTRILTLSIVFTVGGARAFGEVTGSDGEWYLGIARSGYDDGLDAVGADGKPRLSNLAFFPLYPTLVRLVSWTGLSVEWSALVVTATASLVAAWGLVRFGESISGPRVGTILAILWGVQPAAVALSMALSEALFTACAVWALVHALRGRLVVAASLSALAGLTRPTGIAVALAVWWAAVAAIRHRDRVWEAVVAVVVAPLGLLVFAAFVAGRVGAWDGYRQVQESWGSTIDWGATVSDNLDRLFRVRAVSLSVAMWLVVIALVLLVLLYLMRPPALVLVYTTVLMFLVLAQSNYLQARQRFLLVAFPLLLPVASWLARRSTRASVALLGIAALASAWYGSWLLFALTSSV